MADFRIAKPNRIRNSEPKTHATIKGAMPPTGIHTESRKERDKRRALAVRKSRSSKTAVLTPRISGLIPYVQPRGTILLRTNRALTEAGSF